MQEHNLRLVGLWAVFLLDHVQQTECLHGIYDAQVPLALLHHSQLKQSKILSIFVSILILDSFLVVSRGWQDLEGVWIYFPILLPPLINVLPEGRWRWLAHSSLSIFMSLIISVVVKWIVVIGVDSILRIFTLLLYELLHSFLWLLDIQFYAIPLISHVWILTLFRARVTLILVQLAIWITSILIIIFLFLIISLAISISSSSLSRLGLALPETNLLVLVR